MKAIIWASLLSAQSFSALGQEQKTSYPIIDDLALVKRETTALCEDGVDPDQTTGLSKIICNLRDFLGVKTVGFFGPLNVPALGSIQTSAKLSTVSDGFNYKIEQWFFDSNSPSNTHKAVDYQFSEDGKKGRIDRQEIFLPEFSNFGFNKWTASVAIWDSTNPQAQSLTWRFHQTKDGASKDYSNTYWAAQYTALIDSLTNVAELATIQASSGMSAYKFQSFRNSTHTLFKASSCTFDGGTCSSPRFECVANATKVIEAQGNSFDEAAKEGCIAFVQMDFTLTLDEPTQANLDLLNDTSGRLTKLNTKDPMER